MNENEQLSHIKKVGEIDNISREEFEFRIQEIARCKRDICYFAEKYFRIISLDKGLHIITLSELFRLTELLAVKLFIGKIGLYLYDVIFQYPPADRAW